MLIVLCRTLLPGAAPFGRRDFSRTEADRMRIGYGINRTIVIWLRVALGRRCGPLGADSGAGRGVGCHAGQTQGRRRVAGRDGHSVRRHRLQLFRHERRRTPDALSQGVRTDSFRLFDRPAGRARIFLFVPQGRRHAQQTGGAGGGAGCRHDGGALLHHGLVHDDDGRRDVGRRDQHARTGRRTAGFQRHARRGTPWPTRWASWEPSSR